jgi:hypothetical protein
MRYRGLHEELLDEAKTFLLPDDATTFEVIAPAKHLRELTDPVTSASSLKMAKDQLGNRLKTPLKGHRFKFQLIVCLILISRKV